MGTLQSGSALFMRYIDAATNAAWRTGMRDLAARLALRYGAACSMPQRKCCGAPEPSKRIDRWHERTRRLHTSQTVSYTHLTLPTQRIV